MGWGRPFKILDFKPLRSKTLGRSQKLYDTMNGLQGTLISKKQANEDVQIDSDDDTKELAEEMASYTKKKGLKTKEQKEAE